ncbi:MAG: hypothetical protein ACK4YP_25310 [Myxococcota bacterium]
MRWPIGIALALLAVVAVQLTFVWVAVESADPVDPTYATEKR